MFSLARSRIEQIAGVGLALAVVFPSFFWVKADRRVWPWDQAWYGEVSADLYYFLVRHPAAWLNAMLAEMPSKPPLLPWVGQFFVPLGIATGDIDFVLLSAVVLTQAATLWIIWLAARKMSKGDNWLALLAVLTVGSAPLFVGMSHQYMVEPLQTLIVAASFYLALVAARVPFTRLIMLLGLLIVAGFAVKTTTIAYCGLAWVIAFVVAIQQFLAKRTLALGGFPDLILLLVLIGALALTGGWYITNVEGMLAHIRDATSNETAELYGHREAILAKIGFWIPTANQAFFLAPYVLVVCVVVVAAALVFVAFRARRRDSDRPAFELADPAIVAGAAFAHAIGVLILLATQVNEDHRFLFSILPGLALATIWAVRTLGMRRLAIPLGIFALAQLVLVHLQALDLAAPLSSEPWLLPIKPNVDDRRVIDAIENETCQPQLADRYSVIGMEYPGMNANSMGYESAKARISRGYRCIYTGLGYAETNFDKAIERINSLKIAFIVLPREDRLAEDPDALNLVVRPVADFVSHNSRYARSAGDFSDYQVYRRAD